MVEWDPQKLIVIEFFASVIHKELKTWSDEAQTDWKLITRQKEEIVFFASSSFLFSKRREIAHFKISLQTFFLRLPFDFYFSPKNTKFLSWTWTWNIIKSERSIWDDAMQFHNFFHVCTENKFTPTRSRGVKYAQMELQAKRKKWTRKVEAEKDEILLRASFSSLYPIFI